MGNGYRSWRTPRYIGWEETPEVKLAHRVERSLHSDEYTEFHPPWFVGEPELVDMTDLFDLEETDYSDAPEPPPAPKDITVYIPADTRITEAMLAEAHAYAAAGGSNRGVTVIFEDADDLWTEPESVTFHYPLRYMSIGTALSLIFERESANLRREFEWQNLSHGVPAVVASTRPKTADWLRYTNQDRYGRNRPHRVRKRNSGNRHK